jgi:hypothetical protein
VTGIIRTQLAGLARAVALLKERVRAAVAGELGRAVSGAVRQVVQAAVAGQADPPAYRRPAASSAGWDDEDEEDRWGRPRDPWADAPEDDDDDRDRRQAAPVQPSGPPPADTGVTAAVAAGVSTARWWLARKGTLLAAVGLGLGVGLLGLFSHPVARAAVAVLAAAADILAATDALGSGAARLGHL